jgi:uncharacterized damage-inducible protein DinB
MKSINSNQLLETLKSEVRRVILEGEQLKNLSPALLEQAPAAGRWSIAQVLEHLNLYSRHYIPSIEKSLHFHPGAPQETFKPGWLGNYFTNLMKPAVNGTIRKKMKAPKNGLPSPQPNSKQMLEEFLQHQHQLLNLLNIAKKANLGNTRVPTSLSSWITLKLGDTFRFFVAHEQRHFIQIENCIKELQQPGVGKAA